MIVESLIKPVSNLIHAGLDKIWMDKGEKEKLEFSKDELKATMTTTLASLAQQGKFKELEMVFKEAQAQRDYQIKSFGSAEVLKDFFLGRVILVGRASIRWVIVAFAAYETNKIIGWIITEKMIAALMAGNMKGQALWLVTTVVILIVGIPMAYVTGASIEKLLKSRGVI